MYRIISVFFIIGLSIGCGKKCGDASFGPVFTSATQSSILLSWEATKGYYDEFVVYREGAQIKVFKEASATSFMDTSLMSDKVYKYVVEARNSSCSSASKIHVEAKTLP